MLKGNSQKKAETRKLQVTGGSTYILSLPKKWVLQNHMDKGNLLMIREVEDGSLSIFPPKMEKLEKTEEAKIRVSIKDSSDAIIRKTVSAYLVGYNTISVKARKPNNLSSIQRNAVKLFARNLLVGTEIVTDSSAELKLQVLLSYPELSVQSALRRMSVITCSMHREAISALKSLNHQLAKDVVATDNEVDRFHLYLIRQLKMAVKKIREIKEIGLKTARDCLGYRLITKTVERTADHAANVAKNVLLLKEKVEPEILGRIEKMSKLAISSFETAMDSLFKRNFLLAESVIKQSQEITSLGRKIVLSFKETRLEESTNLRLLIESIRRTAEYASDIAEIVLNLTVESVLE